MNKKPFVVTSLRGKVKLSSVLVCGLMIIGAEPIGGLMPIYFQGEFSADVKSTEMSKTLLAKFLFEENKHRFVIA